MNLKTRLPLERRLDWSENQGRQSVSRRLVCARRRDHLHRKGTRSNPFEADGVAEAFAFARGSDRPSWCMVDGELGKYYPTGQEYEPLDEPLER